MSEDLVAFLRDRLRDLENAIETEIETSAPLYRSGAELLADVAALRTTINHLANLAAACPEDDWPDDGNMCAAPVADQARYILRLLAQPYADHPDFREEWKT